MENGIRLLSVLFLFVLVLFVCAACSSPFRAQEDGLDLQVTFFRVGGGEGALISCPDRSVRTLIDAGGLSGENRGAELQSILRRLMGSEKKLTYAISTSSQIDRMGGFLPLLQGTEFSIGSFIDSGMENPASELDNEIRSLLEKKGINRVDFSDGRIATLEVCPGSSTKRANLLFFPMRDIDVLALSCAQRISECALMARLEYKGMSALFPSTIGTAREDRLLSDPALRSRLRSDIFHLSESKDPESPSMEYLEAVNPAYAVRSSVSPAGVPLKPRTISSFFCRKYPKEISAEKCASNSQISEKIEFSLHPRVLPLGEGGLVSFSLRERDLKIIENP